ncbi:MAG: phosphopantetheine-binding protein, partial [Comamonas sp.]
AQEGAGGARLVGYVSARAGQAIDAGELKRRLSEALPEYMVPGAIVVLEALPLNANGKVDRKTLPQPSAIASASHEMPQGDLEEALAAIWTDVLGVGRIGRRDSFFDVGGHSLLLLKMHHRIGQQLQLFPSVVDLFKYPTIESLAAFLRRGASQPDPALKPFEDRAQRQRAAFLLRRPTSAKASP